MFYMWKRKNICRQKFRNRYTYHNMDIKNCPVLGKYENKMMG